MSEWRVYTLDDVSIYVNRGVSPKYVVENGICVINQKCIRNGKINFSLARLHDKNKNFTEEKVLNTNDILINSTGVGTAGRVSIFDEKVIAIVDSHVSILRINQNNSYPKFIFHNLRNREKELEEIAEGSTGQIELKRDSIKKLYVYLPPLPEQKAIAEILSSLDDKIDLLHRQNKTLEAMAETLFRQWFVEEAEEDWEEGKLNDLVTFNYGKTLKKQTRSGSGYPVVGSSGIVDFHNKYLVEAPGIVTGRKGTLGIVNFLYDNFFPIDTTFYITSKLENSSLYFEYFLLKTLGLRNMNSDSAVPGLNRNIAHAIPLTIPPIQLIDKFTDYCKPMFFKIRSNQAQIQILSRLRDTLLPKLMSGEFRVQYDKDSSQ